MFDGAVLVKISFTVGFNPELSVFFLAKISLLLISLIEVQFRKPFYRTAQ